MRSVRGIGRRGFLLASAALAGASLVPTLPAVPSRAASPVLRSLDYRGVRLLPSRWQQQQEDVLAYYLAVPTDNYLRGFRLRAGLSAPGEELGGWYSDDVFNCFGQVVSGLARFAVATGNGAAATKVHDLVAGFTECIAADGFFYYSSAPNAPHYGYDKILGGLLDAQAYADVETTAQIGQITTWARDPAHLDRSNVYGYNAGSGATEWYTLSENLYRAVVLLGDDSYAEFAKVWEYRGFWDRFYRGENWFQDPDGRPVSSYHAYSHVNALNGLGAGFVCVGDTYYRDALIAAHDAVRESQTYATGGYGPYEALVSDRDVLRKQLSRSHWHFETQCGSWAVFKLAKYLLAATGDGRFGDWAEQLLYNGIGASIPSSADGGVQYFSDYSTRGGTKFLMNPWSCCSGTRPQAIADYTDLVFLASADQTGIDRLCVNLFLPATVDVNGLEAHLDTSFPESELVELTIQAAPATPVEIAFRAPGWLSADPELRIDGQVVDAPPSTEHWVGVRRTWQPGTVLSLRLPMAERDVPFDPGHDFPVATVRGPVVLATDANDQDQPFYAYPPDTTYFLYRDPTLAAPIEFTGDWAHNIFIDFSNTAGATATWAFDGTAFVVHWRQFDDAGIAAVFVDGTQIGEIDQYGPVRDVPDQTGFDSLPAGSHTVRIEWTGRRNPASSNTYINLADLLPG